MYIIYVFVLLLIAEFGSYLWHKHGAHKKIIPEIFGVQAAHKRHHTIVNDEAHEDFFFIVLFLIFYLGVLTTFYLYQQISLPTVVVLYLPFFVLSVWTWYVHSAYHVEDHWLNRYEWFRIDKRLHFQHHDNPKTNYGISTHIFDVIFDSFDYGLLRTS